MNNQDNSHKIYKSLMLVILTAIITFIITSTMVYNKLETNNLGTSNLKYIAETDSIGKIFQTFKKFINKNYVGEINEEEMLQGAIKGYVEGLGDPYSEYITKKEMKEYLEDTLGKYVGIGIYITNNQQTNQIQVLMPMKSSPAENAGIQEGDVITKVNDVQYTGEQLSEAAEALKGKEGTKVKIEILRAGETQSLEVERKQIKVDHVEGETLEKDSIGYIKINTFDEGSTKEFEQKWEELKSKKVTSLIIDLRNNGGGIVEEATGIADMMTNKGQILLITAGKKDEEKIEKAKENKKIDIPIVVLVNENTASAAEILAVAIKENNDNVKIVGKTTYGKGVIQTIFKLSDGSGIKLTTNEYFTPKHNVINKKGIKPDIEVELPKDEKTYLVKRENDTQLKKAIEILK